MAGLYLKDVEFAFESRLPTIHLAKTVLISKEQSDQIFVAMVLFTRTSLAAAAVLSIVQIGSTAPTTPGAMVETIIKRAIVRFEDCGDANDPKSKVSKAGVAFAYAATLARWTFDNQLDDGTSFQDTNA